MKMLFLHAKAFRFETVRPAVKEPPDPPGKGECGNCLVVFVSVERGDGIQATARACSEISSWAGKVGAEEVLVYPYAHLSRDLAGVGEAHRALQEILECLRGKGLKAGRAPLGWYKEFALELQGHPLAESFREISAESSGIVVEAGEETLSLGEAVEKGLIDKRWLAGVDPQLLEVMDRLCLNPSGSSSFIGEYTMKLERWLAGQLGLDQASIYRVRVDAPLRGSEATHFTALIASCSQIGQDSSPLIAETCAPGGSIMVMPGPVDIGNILDKLSQGISGDLVEVNIDGRRLSLAYQHYRVARGRLIGYMSEKRIIPVAMEVAGEKGSTTCIGPLGSIIEALVGHELNRAGKGGVPLIPPWLHSYQAAVIPVSEGEEEYSGEVARKLAKIGASVALIPYAGERLGSRIRRAATRWIPYIVVVGKREVETSTVNVRRRWRHGEQEVVSLGELVEEVERVLSEAPVRIPRIRTLTENQRC
ncbi:MAG: hypothetical protein LRS43_02095 [Desulfurococcales archaeon]|nr:hypothetical protein [Desulfurococcales archaeon]